jgi:hypothetical protein
VAILGVKGDREVRGQIWNGTSWTRSAKLGTAPESFWWGFDVAYERQHDRAVAVSSTNEGPVYWVWDGAGWAVEAAAFPAEVSRDQPRQLRMAANPLSDSNELALVVNTVAGSDYAAIWDGVSWGHYTSLDGPGGDTDVYVAYEQVSGRAMVVYGKRGSPDGYYRLWDGERWLGEGQFPAPTAETLGPRWMTLAADPTSNRIALGVVTRGSGEESHIWLSMWTGTAWESPSNAGGAQASNVNWPAVAVAFEGTSGQAVAAYSADGAGGSVETALWGAGAGWTLEARPAIGSHSRSLMLFPHPVSDRIMAMFIDSNEALYHTLWNGDEWGALTELEADTREQRNQPFLFLWLGR